MSKKIIAGAGVVASLAVALAPLATFATVTNDTEQTDTLQITIEEVCSFGSTDITPTVPAVAHDNGTVGTWSGDTLSRNITNGTGDTNFGSTTLSIVCNDTDGYELFAKSSTTKNDNDTLKAVMQNAGGTEYFETGTTLDGTVSNFAFKLINGSGTGNADYNGATITSGYTSFSAIPAAASGNGTKVAGHTDSTSRDDIVVTYGVGVSPTQAADTYTGGVIYTLASIDN